MLKDGNWQEVRQPGNEGNDAIGAAKPVASVAPLPSIRRKRLQRHFLEFRNAMNRLRQMDVKKDTRSEYLEVLKEHHTRSGLSLREVALVCDLDHSYVSYILSGARRPCRDVIIALGFAYGLERFEVDEILLLAGYPPLGRGLRRGYSQSLRQE